jgi:hypothetical protein
MAHWNLLIYISSNYSKEIQAGLSKSKTHPYLNATLDSKKCKESIHPSIHPLYEERPQARHQKRRPIWRLERPEDLKLSTILPIQEKKNQDYNNTAIVWNRQKKYKKLSTRLSRHSFICNQMMKGRSAFRCAKLSSRPIRRVRSLDRQDSNPAHYREANLLRTICLLKINIYRRLIGPPYFVWSQDSVCFGTYNNQKDWTECVSNVPKGFSKFLECSQ